MKILYKALLPLLLLLPIFVFSQGGAFSCAELQANFQQYQSCATSIPFTNSTNNPSGEAFNTTCIEEPFQGPTWFFMKIKSSGDIQLQISQVSTNGNGTDVDFVLWGPFADLNSVCGQLDIPNEVDCSWLANAVENATINNAIAGELYVLLVDNYSNVPGEITITQTGGTGSSDCGFLSAVEILDNTANEISQLSYCKPDTKELVATVDNSDFPGNLINYRYNYKWYKDDVLIASITDSANSTNSITASETGAYKVDMTAYDSTDPTVDPNLLEVSSDDISLVFVDAPDITLELTGEPCYSPETVLHAIDNSGEFHDYTYTWFRNNAVVPGASANTFTPINSGAYFVRVSNGVCAPFDSNIININATPVVSITDDQSICEGTSYTLTSTIFNSGELTAPFYQWYKDGVAIPGANGTSYTVTSANQTPGTVSDYLLYVTENGVCIRQSNLSHVTIYPKPQLVSNVVLDQCDYIAPNNDGLAITNLTQVYNTLTNNNSQYILTYYLDSGLTQPIANPSSFTNATPSQTIYVTGILPGQNPVCTSNIATISLTVNPTTVATYTNMAPVCPELNGNFGFMDFESHKQVIKDTFFPTNDVTITFYANENDASVEQSPLTNATQMPIGTTTIYTRVEMGNNCFEVGTFQAEVHTAPVQTVVTNINICTSEAVILSTKDPEALSGQSPSVQSSYFYSFDNAENNVAPIAKNTPVNFPAGQTPIFARLYDNNINCFSIVSFEVGAFPNPASTTPDPITTCGDTAAVFDLTVRNTQITDSHPDYLVTFYETQTDMDNGNSIPTPTAYTSGSRTLLVKIINPANTGCPTITSLTLQVTATPGSPDNPDIIQLCDDSGFGVFDVTQNEQQMAGSTPLSELGFRYYTILEDAQANNDNTIADPTSFTNTEQGQQTVYVRVNSTINADSETGIFCYRILEQNVYARPHPQNNLYDYPYKICVDIDGNVVNAAVIDAGLPHGPYDFIWYNGFDAVAGNEIFTANGSVFTTETEGEYSVRITDLTNLALCHTIVNFTTRNSFIPFSLTGNPTELVAFETDNTITAIVTPQSDDFEYSLDNTPWQDSNVFTDVREGIYTLSVRNKYGCGELSTMVVVTDYPRFFTPNGDGYNDNWNIGGRLALDKSNVFIYDRYGKLLTEIVTNETGWDGTYNGNPMPADDYWFRINYTVGGQKKEFLGHFSLKR